MSRPPRGRSIVEVSLSSVSNILSPNTILTSCQSLKESRTVIPNNHTAKPSAVAETLREMLVFSTIYAMVGSTSEMAEVHAANATSIKNSVAIKLPQGM